MHELSGKRVEVKSATPRGSGPVAGRGMIGDRRMLSHGAPMGGRGMGMMPSQMSPQYGMNPYRAVGYATLAKLPNMLKLHGSSILAVWHAVLYRMQQSACVVVFPLHFFLQAAMQQAETHPAK